MFITYEAHKSPLSGLFGDKASHWRAVEIALNRTWYLVSVQQFESDAKDSLAVQSTMLLGNLDEVEKLTLAHNDVGQFRIESIQVVTPSHINGSNEWKMDVLASVLSAEDPEEHDQPVDVLVTREGVHYADSWVRTPLEKLRLGAVRFRSPGSPISR